MTDYLRTAETFAIALILLYLYIQQKRRLFPGEVQPQFGTNDLESGIAFIPVNRPSHHINARKFLAHIIIEYLLREFRAHRLTKSVQI